MERRNSLTSDFLRIRYGKSEERRWPTGNTGVPADAERHAILWHDAPRRNGKKAAEPEYGFLDVQATEMSRVE